MFSKIMIPVDLNHTEQMGKALAVAADLTRTYDADIHIVGVTMTTPTEIAPTPESFARKLGEFASERSSELGIPIQSHAEISHDLAIDLDEILMRTADRIGVDLVVMASHVPGFAEYVFASNAGYLASHASMSVMVVR